ncbi:hypothetical protein F4810DRAFT_702816 [Camillea tinctor]|nr:hypothetical protein F4810DRAFT_702816 [Camillea tinctor]
MPISGKKNRGCDVRNPTPGTCDGEEPCSRCSRKRLPCGRNFRVRFRIYEQSHQFSLSQRWVRTSGKRTQFIDQSQEICSLYDGGVLFDDDPPSELEVATSPTAGSYVSPPLRPTIGRDGFGEGLATLPHISEVLRLSPGRRTSIHFDLGSLANRSTSSRHDLEPIENYSENLSTHPSLSPNRSGSHGGDCRHELSQINYGDNRNLLEHLPIPAISFHPRNEQLGTLIRSHSEADLVRHFVESLAPAFELDDPARSFTAEIVQRAIADSILLESILAVSSKHLDRPKDIESDIELRYQRQVQQYISLTRYDNEQPLDENLFGALLLHRLCQNLEDQSQHHVCSILTTQAPFLPKTQFVEALFWSSLRQEIYIAVIYEEPVRIDSRDIKLDRSTEPADDCTWANRITLQLLDVIQYCFGDAQSVEAYDALLEGSIAWMESKPASFTPIFVSEPTHGDLLPEVWLFNGFVAAGLQYYYLCRLLLIAHDPKTPRIGIRQKETSRLMEDHIKEYVKIICGIAESISTISPAYLAACMAISLAGDRFTEPDEQETFFNILTKTTGKFGWNTTKARDTLRDAWKDN